MEVVPYRDEFKDAVVALWGFDKGSAYVRNKRAIWDWQYSENPCAGNLSKGMAVIDDGEVVAFLGIMPVMLKYGDRVVEAHWTLDGVMDPRLRGKGYGFKAYDAGVKAGEQYSMGIGMNDITEHLLKKSGCIGNDEVEQYVYSNKSGGLKDAAKKAIQQLTVLKHLAGRPSVKDLTVRVIAAADMPKDVDTLWASVMGGYDKIVVRDYSYMHWKYGRHPLANYRLVVVERGKELAGVGVFRKGKTRSWLVDYLGPADDLAVKFLIAKTFKHECSRSEFLQCISSDKQMGTALEQVGIRRYKEKERFYVYSAIEGDEDYEKNWFIMGGESDGDIGDHLLELQEEGQ
jgi:hypothetical protein